MATGSGGDCVCALVLMYFAVSTEVGPFFGRSLNYFMAKNHKDNNTVQVMIKSRKRRTKIKE